MISLPAPPAQLLGEEIPAAKLKTHPTSLTPSQRTAERSPR
jgi:hypothetical protein